MARGILWAGLALGPLELLTTLGERCLKTASSLIDLASAGAAIVGRKPAELLLERGQP